MDLVTTSLLTEFRKENGFPDELEQPTVFEHFVNYCVGSKEYTGEFELEDLHVAGANDLQLDGVLVIVNGLLISTCDEVDDLLQTNSFLDAEFVFTQAKTGSNFDGAELSDMFYGVRDLFSQKPTLPRNENLQAKEAIIRHIYTKSSRFRRGLPIIKMYYVNTGRWEEDEKLLARIETEKADLERLNVFRSVHFFPVDARGLQQLFNRAQNALQKTITFTSKVTLPAMQGLKASYLGFLPLQDYLKLVTDENDNLLRGLFYDNVRDYQPQNAVNAEIAETLEGSTREHFVLLNNGVTIVAEDLIPAGDQFTLSGYQVVNGCQTTHVLFQKKDSLSTNMQVPVKLIIQPDEQLKNRIIKATNRQTAVKDEELSALTDFQKGLEEFYKAIAEEHRLYYERRSQQYRSVSGLEKIRVVSISTQIRTFASMFLLRAHRASRYYGTLLKDIENAIFVDTHSYLAYYLSAYALFRIESQLRKRQIDPKYRPFKYHMLGIIRSETCGVDMPSLNSRAFGKYIYPLQETLWNDERCVSAIRDTCKKLDCLLENDYDRDKAKDASLQMKASALIKNNGVSIDSL